jgi:predicted HicB family RNase H-like nuclease
MPSSQTTGHGSHNNKGASGGSSLPADGKLPKRDGRAQVNLRMDPDLVRRIDAEAESRLVSRAWLVAKVMNDWLEEHSA